MFDSQSNSSFYSSQPAHSIAHVELTAQIITAIADQYCRELPSDTAFLDSIVLRAAESPMGDDRYLHLVCVAMVKVGRRDLADEIRFYRSEVISND